MKKKKENTLRKKFIKVFLLSFILLSIISATVIIVLINIQSNDSGGGITDFLNLDDNNNKDNEDIKKRDKLNIAVFGVDEEGYRTDVIMIANINLENKKVNIISIPRDSRIELDDDIYNRLKQRRSDTPRNLKINAIPAYAPSDKRNEYSVEALENLFSLKIDIDYYVNLNLEAFRDVVDLIGGVEVIVPNDMEYVDSYQDLYINLKAGRQNLNGAQAEQLIRYREGYATGDIGRIEMQHEFMNEFLKKILSDENSKLKTINIISTVLEKTKTNFAINDAIEYINYFLEDFGVNQIEMLTIPGEAKDIGEISYFVIDHEEAINLINQINNDSLNQELIRDNDQDTEEDTEEEVEEHITALGKNIQILNSTDISGLASDTQNRLEEDGYTVVNIGNYTEQELNRTKIIVSQEGMEKDLIGYFDKPKVEIKSELPEGVDINIILGTIQ